MIDDSPQPIVLPPSAFALRLQRLGVRQATLARQAQVTPQFVHDVFHGRRPPSRRLLRALDRLERELAAR